MIVAAILTLERILTWTGLQLLTNGMAWHHECGKPRLACSAVRCGSSCLNPAWSYSVVGES